MSALSLHSLGVVIRAFYKRDDFTHQIIDTLSNVLVRSSHISIKVMRCFILTFHYNLYCTFASYDCFSYPDLYHLAFSVVYCSKADRVANQSYNILFYNKNKCMNFLNWLTKEVKEE